MSGLNQWGDDEEDENFLPPKIETKVDSKGMKKITEYHWNDLKQKVRVVKEVKVSMQTVRRTKNAEERRQRLVKFGNAAGVEDESNVTIIDYNPVHMLHPKDADAEDDTQAANVSSAFAKFQKKQQMRNLQRKYDLEYAEDGEGDAPPEDGEDAVPEKIGLGALKAAGQAGGGPGGSKYVPPGARQPGGATGGGGRSLEAMSFDDKDRTTIRVTNISEDTKENDLQELFERYGRIYRIYLAKDRETHQSRGFAFVSFSRMEDAERAMAALQGYGYDHLILKLEWARPSQRDADGGGGGGTQYRSGYGKALAQDTTEKVSYASNLTK